MRAAWVRSAGLWFTFTFTLGGREIDGAEVVVVEELVVPRS